MTTGGTLSLADGLFERDAIVLKNMKSTEVTLRSRKSNEALKFSFSGFPFFGIWSKPGASFLCLEPWCGLADKQHFTGEFKDREGVEKLAPGTTFRRTFRAEVVDH